MGRRRRTDRDDGSALFPWKLGGRTSAASMTLSFFFFFFFLYRILSGSHACRQMNLFKKINRKKKWRYMSNRPTAQYKKMYIDSSRRSSLYKHPLQTIAFCWCYKEIIPTEERGLFFISAYNIPLSTIVSSLQNGSPNGSHFLLRLWVNSFLFLSHIYERGWSWGGSNIKVKRCRQWTGRPVKSNQFWIELNW